MVMLPITTNNIPFKELSSDLLKKRHVKLVVARLDQLHPIVSGNKLFKLHYFLAQAIASIHKTVLTFGGAYSNHLVATAFACQQLNLKSIGVVRGEAPKELSHTLQQCISYGMQLHFITRSDYKNPQKEEHDLLLHEKFGPFILIPEGGYDPLGAKGAALIMDVLAQHSSTHICTAIGTATTYAGLLLGKNATQQIIGIPVIKNMTDIEERVSYLTGENFDQLKIFDEYHFGGYAKKTDDLIRFMNEFYSEHEIPTDFVYTAKMFYAIFDQLKKGFFKEGSMVVLLHTGGLQGNQSLPKGSLIF